MTTLRKAVSPGAFHVLDVDGRGAHRSNKVSCYFPGRGRPGYMQVEVGLTRRRRRPPITAYGPGHHRHSLTIPKLLTAEKAEEYGER